MTYPANIHIFEPTDPRPGRHVYHDERNWQYAYQGSDLMVAYESTQLPTVEWTSHLPISDQGNVGACVGFTVLDLLGYDLYWNALTEAEQQYLAANLNDSGFLLYHTATVLDGIPGQWRPDDTGSDGSSGAKAGVKLGYLSGYQHAFGPQALDAALTKGPVMVGTRWDNSMMTPDSGGVIVPDRSSGVAGGHEYLIVGYNYALDAYKMRNHWTADWGLQGFAYIPRLPFLGLLADQGDATVPVPLNQPKPTPTPPKPKPAVIDQRILDAAAKLNDYIAKNGK